MIVSAFRVFGREIIIEYNPAATWSSWQFFREGKDTHTFLGKIELVTTNHWKRSNKLATKIMLMIMILSAVSAEALHVVRTVLERGGPNGL